MKQIIFSLLLLLPVSADAQNRHWEKPVRHMIKQLIGVKYQEYDYELKTVLGQTDSLLIKGKYYVNRVDSLFLHQNGEQTLLVTPRCYIMKDTASKEIVIVQLTDNNPEKRQLYFKQFFDASSVRELESVLTKQAQYIGSADSSGSQKFTFKVKDGVSYECELKIELSKASLPIQLTYDILRHTDFKSPGPATDMSQLNKCYGYSFERNRILEEFIEAEIAAVNSETNTNSYKIIRL